MHSPQESEHNFGLLAFVLVTAMDWHVQCSDRTESSSTPNWQHCILQPTTTAPPLTKEKGQCDADYFWTQPEWCAWLSAHCSVCEAQCTLDDLPNHLAAQHSEVLQKGQEEVHLCSRPMLDCCHFCRIVDLCPVALNISRWLIHHVENGAGRRSPDAAARDLRKSDCQPKEPATRGGLWQLKRSRRPRNGKRRQSNGKLQWLSGHSCSARWP